MSFSTFSTTILATLIVTSHVATAHYTYYSCIHENPSPVNVISATAVVKEDLTPAFEAFRFLLEDPSNGNLPRSNPEGGHRQINWDASILPFDMPGDFFANTVTRGCMLSSANDAFKVSNPSEDTGITDDKFNSILTSDMSVQFNQFSPSRLFSPFDDNEVVVTFVDPGNTDIPASVTGFGAVFVDVDLNFKTKMEFFDDSGCLLAVEYVKPEPSGLSFLGVDFGGLPLIASVKITLGTISLRDISDGNVFGWHRDLVVMDDFLYGEPTPIEN